MRRLRVAAGFAVALLVTGILVYGTGWEAVVSSIRRADPILIAGGAVAGATMLALRALIVYRLLGPVEGSARGADFVGAFLAGYFSRSVVPWGQSVGVAVTAYLLAGSSESPFEDNAAVISVRRCSSSSRPSSLPSSDSSGSFRTVPSTSARA
ncbi:lysylphosphatidylglycerol synthase domain-containing protein [Natronosalvus halobius]|uniref:lysylphosphatidylglycerol synthase domain-containing protein n=1 Tax=Natronosalvus halobius TaxID=2953746 RepID=UPI0020A1C59F|nr:lysylphosphatidylglycerol synthase domain-containing protein [Natronosalvus halobius]USZ72067.1 flippase-like domain-containing protein [Natronosalvus halobius]